MTVTDLSYFTKYYWRVNASNDAGMNEWSALWSFTTIVAPPAIPTLANPDSGSTVLSTNLTLSWNSAKGAATYELEVSKDLTFNNSIFDQTGIDSTQYTLNNLSLGVNYYWRVNASNAGGTSAWSTAWSFAVGPITVTSLKPVQSGVVKLVYGVNTNTALSLTKFEYSVDGGTNWNSTLNYTGSVSSITGSRTDTIYWNTKNDLPSVESRSIGVRLTFHSANTFSITLDSVGVDNLAPRLNGIRNVVPGWSDVSISWNDATDMSKPVSYHLVLTKSGSAGTTVLDTIFTTDSISISNLYSSTQYKASILGIDALGNVDSASITTTFRTGAVADYNGDGVINAYDLAALVLAWTNGDLAHADLSPFVGTFPILDVHGDGALTLDDIYVFAKMWDYSHRVGLPTSVASQLANVSFSPQPIRNKLIAHKGEPMEFKFSPGLTGDFAALGIRVNYGRAVRTDSVRVLLDGLSLEYNDTSKGIIYVDLAKTGGLTLNGDDIMTSRMVFDPSKSADSIEVELVGYDGGLTESFRREYLFSVSIVPSKYALFQNYPNPFNPTTTIFFDLPERAKVKLTIYDALGRKVEGLLDDELDAGTYRTRLDGSRFSSGVYFYRLSAGNFTQVKKLILLK